MLQVFVQAMFKKITNNIKEYNFRYYESIITGGLIPGYQGWPTTWQIRQGWMSA